MKRHLTPAEIEILESRGSRAEDWRRVRVSPDFTPGESFREVFFSGDVELGAYRRPAATPDGFPHPSGVSHSWIRDVSIGDDCLVLHSRLAGADVLDGAALDRVGLLSGSGDAGFAHASAANVLAEDGARSVPLWRFLSAQAAHLICHLKNHPATERLEAMIRRDAEQIRSPRSRVGRGARICRTGALRDVFIGDGASVMGAAELENCYLGGSADAPVRIGEGVSARHCVFMGSCRVEDGARLTHCLVGEGARLDGAFSGTHSLFFANSAFSLGEADCAMAGPFAESMHKASLVLTCQCSFSTFGSASNSSNHHFKLGPRHGGVLRRGVKCGSGSYIFWPSDIGAFSTVVGRHLGNLDSVDFPFSLLIGENGKSILIPGVNVFGAGCFRDGLKWPQRDRRDGVAAPLDLVNTAVFSPYTLQAMDAGAETLRRSQGRDVDLRCGGAVIPASRLEPALRLYQAALTFHTGERLFARLAARLGNAPASPDDVVAALAKRPIGKDDPSAGQWRDWGGMLLSGFDAESVLGDLEAGKIRDAGELADRLGRVHAAYDENEWLWLAARWRRDHGEPDRENAIRFLSEWRKAALFRHECFIKDATKEFTPEAKYGFGVEAPAATRFQRVRGELGDHAIVPQAEAERDRFLRLVDSLDT